MLIDVRYITTSFRVPLDALLLQTDTSIETLRSSQHSPLIHFSEIDISAFGIFGQTFSVPPVCLSV